jgi:hypothetical protein
MMSAMLGRFIMRFNPIVQPGFNTSLMGVIKGVLDYLGIAVSDAAVFGMTGHAFLINIHDVICPSSPYCWKYEGMFRLVKNLGVTMENLGFFQPDNPLEDRANIEALIRTSMDKGKLCSVLNMDHQLISGYNDTCFRLCIPWPECVELTPETLTYSSWKEFGDDFHCQFFAFSKTGHIKHDQAVRDSLGYALEIFKTPEKYSAEPYAMGLNAYDQWSCALQEGHGDTNGNLWNATVWTECRRMAAKYMDEIGTRYGNDINFQAQQMSAAYWVIAQNLEFVGDSKLPVNRRIALLCECRELESSLAPKLEQLLTVLPQNVPDNN